MRDSADERSKVDRTDTGSDPARDVREEYTSYREEDSASRKKPEGDEEARREADLQPDSVEPERVQKGEDEG